MRVLLIDTNISSAPIYEFLERSGYEVFVTGGNSHDYLAKIARNYINVDYSDLNAMLDIVQSYQIDFIVPGCNDLSYKIASQLNAGMTYFGLDSYETSEILNSKGKFREFAIKINLPVPKVYSNFESIDAWPVIVKPVDAYSGRGVSLVSEDKEHLLNDAIDNAKSFSRIGNFIIEEYVWGQLFSHSAFISDKSIAADFIVEEHCTANHFAVDTSRVVYDFDTKMLAHIREAILKIASELDLEDGLIHTQFIAKGNSFKIIEVTRRCPGDLYSQLIELSTGYKYAEAYAQHFLNKGIEMPEQRLSYNYIMRHTISLKKECLFSSIKFNYPVHIERLIPFTNAGNRIQPGPLDRIGILFTQSCTEKDFFVIFDATVNRELYSTD